MTRLLVLVTTVVAGCQSQSPYAMVGPATVPAPTTAQTPPYYPPPSGGQPPGATASTRPSVSAEGSIAATPGSIAATPARPSFTAEPSDREPLRIVENPTPTRTAAAPGRTNNPAGKSLPPATAPRGLPAPGTAPNSLRTPPASSNAPTSYLPPAASHLRGLGSSVPGSGAGVIPASYQQGAQVFVEAPAGGEQWRAR